MMGKNSLLLSSPNSVALGSWGKVDVAGVIHTGRSGQVSEGKVKDDACANFNVQHHHIFLGCLLASD